MPSWPTPIRNNNSNIQVLTGGGTLTVGDGNNFAFSGVISGTGAVWKTGNGTWTLNGANTYSGDTRILNGVLQIGNTSALQNSTLDMNGADSGTLDMNGMDVVLGGLKGANGVTLVDNQTLWIGNNSQATTYPGALTGNGGLAKIGAGTSTLLERTTSTAPPRSTAAR